MQAPKEPPFTKESGWRHFLAAARYSWQGFRRLLRESAFRQEIASLAMGLLLLLWLQAKVEQLLIFVLLMLVLFAVEAINTAIEELVDRVSPEYSQVGKHAKDLGSFAVSCLILANAAYMIYLVIVLLVR